eukprot:scaffold48652_cov62-Phaeocystis_antarctica.AAC.4
MLACSCTARARISVSEAGGTSAIASRSLLRSASIASAPARCLAVRSSNHVGPLPPAAASPRLMKVPNSLAVMNPEPSSSSARQRLCN